MARVDLRDVLTLLALVLIGAGLGTVSLAAGLAVPGLLLFLLAVVPPLLSRQGGQ
jgi:hypothetical protein